ncbi:ATP-grasp-4 domain containing protein [Curvularia clavata]|uniref:ATP-grasp-4 domain containing protein n=1 Tax=Curvularia clavata TaxID=95742 RepID=A0A9Q8Z159_CURCL|nr:ATP-grasp-4 domain containing protein [Curvularia clavata]
MSRTIDYTRVPTGDRDEALKTYIRRCDRLEMPALVPQVIGAAQRILDMEDLLGKAPRLGRNWISRWLRDNPDYRRKKQKKQELNRVAANTVGNYEAHFKRLKRVIDDYAI